MIKPHDHFFKQVFKDQKNVVDFIKQYLPDKITNELDLSSVQIIDPSANSEEDIEFVSDIVVSCKTRDGTPADIYLLFEHKSYKDKGIYLQLLRYMYEMWQEDFRLKKPFRVIIPVVFYHGTNKWNIPERFLDNFNVSSDLKSYLLDFSYILFDTNRWNPDLEDLSNQNVYLMCSLMLLKMAIRDDWQGVKSILEIFAKNGLLKEDQWTIIFLRYIANTQDISKEEFLNFTSELSSGGTTMTVADIIREEGKLEGEKDALAFVFELKYGEEGVSFFNLIKDRIVSLEDVENIKSLIKKYDNIEELKKELAK